MARPRVNNFGVAIILLAMIALLFAVQASAQPIQKRFEDPKKQQMYEELLKGLRKKFEQEKAKPGEAPGIPPGKRMRIPMYAYCFNAKSYFDNYIKKFDLKPIITQRKGEGIHTLFISKYGSAVMAVVERETVCVFAGIQQWTAKDFHPKNIPNKQELEPYPVEKKPTDT